MKSIAIFILLISIIQVATGCFISSKKERLRLEECRSEWQFKDLTSDKEIQVLLSRGYIERPTYHPNFIIGITSDLDTIGIMDKNFEGDLYDIDKVWVKPTRWTKIEKETIRPDEPVYSDKSMNDLMCKVKVIYFTRIIKVTYK